MKKNGDNGALLMNKQHANKSPPRTPQSPQSSSLGPPPRQTIASECTFLALALVRGRLHCCLSSCSGSCCCTCTCHAPCPVPPPPGRDRLERRWKIMMPAFVPCSVALILISIFLPLVFWPSKITRKTRWERKKEEQIKQLEKNRKIQVHFSLHFTVHSHFRCIASKIKNKLENKTQFGAKTKNEAADFSQFVVLWEKGRELEVWRNHDWAGIHDGPLLDPLHKYPSPQIPDSQDPISTLRRRQAYLFSKTFKVFL